MKSKKKWMIAMVLLVLVSAGSVYGFLFGRNSLIKKTNAILDRSVCISDQLLTSEKPCVDGDNGPDFFRKGVTQDITGEKKMDYCTNSDNAPFTEVAHGKYIVEYVCADGKVSGRMRRDKVCPLKDDGQPTKCIEGVCRVVECSDTDAKALEDATPFEQTLGEDNLRIGKNYFAKGVTVSKTGAKEDSCATVSHVFKEEGIASFDFGKPEGGYIEEYWCEGDEIKTFDIKTIPPEGTRKAVDVPQAKKCSDIVGGAAYCLNGACVPIVCGDGVVSGTETCDPGDAAPHEEWLSKYKCHPPGATEAAPCTCVRGYGGEVLTGGIKGCSLKCIDDDDREPIPDGEEVDDQSKYIPSYVEVLDPKAGGYRLANKDACDTTKKKLKETYCDPDGNPQEKEIICECIERTGTTLHGKQTLGLCKPATCGNGNVEASVDIGSQYYPHHSTAKGYKFKEQCDGAVIMNTKKIAGVLVRGEAGSSKGDAAVCVDCWWHQDTLHLLDFALGRWRHNVDLLNWPKKRRDKLTELIDGLGLQLGGVHLKAEDFMANVVEGGNAPSTASIRIDPINPCISGTESTTDFNFRFKFKFSSSGAQINCLAIEDVGGVGDTTRTLAVYRGECKQSKKKPGSYSYNNLEAECVERETVIRPSTFMSWTNSIFQIVGKGIEPGIAFEFLPHTLEFNKNVTRYFKIAERAEDASLYYYVYNSTLNYYDYIVLSTDSYMIYPNNETIINTTDYYYILPEGAVSEPTTITIRKLKFIYDEAKLDSILDFIDLTNNIFGFKIVIGRDAAAEDNIAGIDIGGRHGIKDVLDDTQATLDENLIVIGGPCVNRIARQLMGITEEFSTEPDSNYQQICSQNFNLGEGTVKIFNNNNKMQILVAGHGASDTRKAARAVVRYAEFRDKTNSNEFKISGADLNEIIVS